MKRARQGHDERSEPQPRPQRAAQLNESAEHHEALALAYEALAADYADCGSAEQATAYGTLARFEIWYAKVCRFGARRLLELEAQLGPRPPFVHPRSREGRKRAALMKAGVVPCGS